ncbi:DNA polymerase I [Aerococcaceae bacterium DSM 111020]|nr:DNA polymerase I [Aerococcaceae bacterium DSM 111020]
MSGKTILLIDGSSLAFRAFYSILDLERFKNKAGLHTNALYSFNRMLDNVLDQFKPTHVLAAFDQAGPTFRTKKYTEYKGGRSKTPSEFKEQMPYIRVLLDAYGIKHYDMAEFEADDIIGTLSRQANSEDTVIILSGDRDLIQLATDQTTVYITKRGVSQIEPNTPATIKEMWDITPKQIIDVKGLMGDSSDNYPGVTRIGEKTAVKLIQQFGSIDHLYEQIDELKQSKMKENLINEEAEARMSRFLAEIHTNVPMEIDIDSIERKERNTEQLIDFYKQMNFNSFLSDLDITLTDDEQENADFFTEDFEYFILDSIEEHHLPQHATLYTETFDSNYHMAEVIGASWCDIEAKKAYYVPWEVFSNSELVKDWLANTENTFVVFDYKREQVIAHRYGMRLGNVAFDVLIANYLIDTNNSQSIADMLTAHELPLIVEHDEVVYGKGAKMAVPETEVLANHMQNKAIALQMLKEPLAKDLESTDMSELYQNIELPLADVLARMEIQGVKVNGDVLREKNQELIERLEEMSQEIHDLAGQTFNINSPKQLGEILFEDLGLPVIKKTKTGYSTAAGVLEKLIDKHPIIEKILDYRQVSKLQGTYLAGLPDYILEDGKIHTRFIQTLTQTGRLSSADPNLQNIPVRLEEGRRIRQAFVPSEENWQLFGADYSQIELRVLAHISGDKHMKEAFINGEDIHTATAQRVFGLPEDQPVDSDFRRQAKAVNFGIVYGISDYGLSQNLNIPRKEAQQFIDTYFEKYPDIAQYMETIVEEARAQGYVETLFNRRRYLPDIKARNFNVRSFAERTAMNSPIQGTAADIIKIAMVELHKALDESDLESRILLQVHDELILEGPSSEMVELSELVPQVMESAVELSVPLLVEYNQGSNWYELK